MSTTMISDEELKRDEPERAFRQGKGPVSIMMTLDMSQEALNRVLWPGLKPRSQNTGKLNMLAAAIFTICEELRDAQHKAKEFASHDPSYTDRERQRELREAGRCAAVAITELEKALHFAVKAAELVQ